MMTLNRCRAIVGTVSLGRDAAETPASETGRSHVDQILPRARAYRRKAAGIALAIGGGIAANGLNALGVLGVDEVVRRIGVRRRWPYGPGRSR
jgi:hypothetical protein